MEWRKYFLPLYEIGMIVVVVGTENIVGNDVKYSFVLSYAIGRDVKSVVADVDG